ncbi:MAG: hypothetical protein IOC35_06865 [Methylobacterium sp.]|jgi:hypothetical protein|nr:hypothetical protein [Methylobacterium sp.]
MKKLLLSLGLLAFWAPIALAQNNSIAAESGKPVRALRMMAVGPDCKPRDMGTPYITEEPKHGQAYLQRRNVSVDDKRCGKITLRALDLYYKSKPGFKGSDSFDFALIREADQTNSGGRETRKFRLRVEVR